MQYLEFLQNFITSNKWFEALVWLIGFLIIAFIITKLSETIFKRWAKKTKTQLDDLILEKIKPPFSYILFLVGLKFALKPLEFNQMWLEHILNSIVIIAVIYIIFSVVDIISRVWSTEFAVKTKLKLDNSLLPILKRVLKVLFFVIGAIWILKEWSFDVTPFLASLGIAGFVVGFAMQDTLKNIFGGITLILDGTFKVGDKIELSDGTIGEIHDITIRSTKIRTYDNLIVTIPNGKIADSKIINYVQPDHKARVVVNFSVAYGSDVNKIKELIQKAVLNNIKDIATDPPHVVILNELGDSALLFRLNLWVNDYNLAYAKRLEATQLVYETLQKEKIEIPFPQMDVNIKK